MGDRYLLMKRGLYWRPDYRGYTGLKSEAGLYTKADAQGRCHDDLTWPVTMIAEHEAGDYSPCCCPYVKAASAEAEVARLKAELKHFTKSGIVEIAVRNPSVAEYMNHWEKRATTAEAEVAKLREALAWYASSEAWTQHQLESADGDYGNRARAALAKANKEEGE